MAGGGEAAPSGKVTQNEIEVEVFGGIWDALQVSHNKLESIKKKHKKCDFPFKIK